MKRIGIFSLGTAALFLMQPAAYGQAGWPQGYYGQPGAAQNYYGQAGAMPGSYGQPGAAQNYYGQPGTMPGYYGQPAYPQAGYPQPYYGYARPVMPPQAYPGHWPQGYYPSAMRPPQYYPAMTPAPMTAAPVTQAPMTPARMTPAPMTAASDLNSTPSSTSTADRDSSAAFQLHEVSRPLPRRAEPVTSAPAVDPTEGIHAPACADAACACCPAAEPCIKPDEKPVKHHLPGFFVDFLYLTPRGTAVNYAQPRDGVTALNVPVGPLGSVEPNFQYGYRAGITYDLDATATVQFTYAWFEASGHDLLLATGTNVIQSLTTFPATANTASDSLAARAVSKVDFQTGDIDFKDCLFSTKNGSVRYLLGGRFAHLGEKFNANYTINGTTIVTTNVKFDGGGPRFGLEGERHFYKGLLIYGRGVANLLAGRFRGDYNQQNVFAGQQADTHYHSDRIVPVTELELGLGWTTPNGKFRITGGYYLAAWFNSVTTPDFIQGVQNTNFATNSNNMSDVLTFDGLAARVEYRF